MQLPTEVRDNPFFRSMSDDQVKALLSSASERNFDGGDTLVRQFDRQSDVMIVVRGKVCIKSFSGEVIAELGPGGVFGEVSLVDDAPRSATVVAVGSGSLAVLPSDKLRTTIDADTALKALVMENIARILCARLRAANVHLDAASGRH